MTAPSKPLPVSPVPPSSSSSPLPVSDASVLPSSDGSPMHGVVEQEEEEEEVRQECSGGDTTAERSLPTMDCDEPQGQQQQGQQRQRLQQEQKEQGQQQQQQQQQHVQLQRQLEQCTLVDGRHSHRDNITARLSFLLWALQAGGMELQPEGLRVIWTELVEHPACPDDRQLALTWLGRGGGRGRELDGTGGALGLVDAAASGAVLACGLEVGGLANAVNYCRLEVASPQPRVLAVTPAPPGATPAPGGLLAPAAALPVGAGAVAGGAAAGEGVQVAVAGDVGGLKGVELVWLLALRCPSPAIWQPCIQLLRDLHSSLVAPEKSRPCHAHGGGAAELHRRVHALPPFLPSSLPPFLPSSLPPFLPSSLPPFLPSSLPPFLPSSLPPFLPSSLPPFLPSSLPPFLPSSLPPFLPSSLPPFLPSSLPPSLPSSLPPFLPSSLPPFLPSSLPPFLPSSLPPFLPSSLPPFLPSSLPPFLPSSPPNPPSPVPSCPTSSILQAKLVAAKLVAVRQSFIGECMLSPPFLPTNPTFPLPLPSCPTSPILQAKLVAVRQSFIGECMRRLAAAMQQLEGGTSAGHNGQTLGGHNVTVEGRSAGGVTPPTGRDALPMETSAEESDGGERTGDARDGGGDVAMAGQEDEGGLEAREKEREGGVAGSGEMNGEGRGGKGGRGSKGGSSLEGQASAEEQAQRCLLLLTQFLTRCEASCPRKVPPHGASYQGRPFQVEVRSEAGRFRWRPFQVEVRSEAGRFRWRRDPRQAVSSGGEIRGRPFQVEVTVAHSKHVNFFVHTHANEYLRLLRLKLNPRPRSRQQGEGGEAELPGVLMARQGEVGLGLRGMGSAEGRRMDLSEERGRGERSGRAAGRTRVPKLAADELLMLLPTHRAILDDFVVSAGRAIAACQPPALACHHLMTHAVIHLSAVCVYPCASMHPTHHQVLDGLLLPVNRQPSPATIRFRASFLQSNGFSALMSVFQSQALPRAADDSTRRKCYMSALHILKLLLFGDHFGGASSTAPGLWEDWEQGSDEEQLPDAAYTAAAAGTVASTIESIVGSTVARTVPVAAAPLLATAPGDSSEPTCLIRADGTVVVAEAKRVGEGMDEGEEEDVEVQDILDNGGLTVDTCENAANKGVVPSEDAPTPQPPAAGAAGAAQAPAQQAVVEAAAVDSLAAATAAPVPAAAVAPVPERDVPPFVAIMDAPSTLLPADWSELTNTIMMLAWAASIGSLQAMGSPNPHAFDTAAAVAHLALQSGLKQRVERAGSGKGGGEESDESEDEDDEEEADEDGADSPLHPDDACLAIEGAVVLSECLARRREIAAILFASHFVSRFIVDTCLHCPETEIRYKFAELFLHISLEKWPPLPSSTTQPAAPPVAPASTALPAAAAATASRAAAAVTGQAGATLGLPGLTARPFTSIHSYIFHSLASARAAADKQPKHNRPYWELLCKVVQGVYLRDEEEAVRKLLDEEIRWLQHVTWEMDGREELLEGHLLLLKVLVEVLECRQLVACSPPHGHGILHLLITRCLFPEWPVVVPSHQQIQPTQQQHQQHHHHNHQQQQHQQQQQQPPGESSPPTTWGLLSSHPRDAAVFRPLCSASPSRNAAFTLLIALCAKTPEALRELASLLLPLHFASVEHELPSWEYLPSCAPRPRAGYSGLKNAGATCYMNSVFQQLFMQPQVRRALLAFPETPESDRPLSVIYQVQAIFSYLLAGCADYFVPEGFWDAFRDYDGQPVNLREHQDAFEFFNRLYDSLDESMKAQRHSPTLTSIFGGHFAQQIICRGCPHRSEREEPFAAVSVDVKGKRGLQESLEAFVQGDLLEADNAYFCGQCGKKVDALKRACIKTLPPTLIIHLKRFDFDYETMQRLKLKDRFTFPLTLNMRPFTREGLAQKEREQRRGRYSLVGVVVHSGTAFAGHYYSYIKERSGDSPLHHSRPSQSVRSKQRWLCFDDKRVEAYDVRELEKDCFGGKYSAEVYDNLIKTSSPQEFDRPNSAYMLFYERNAPTAAGASTTSTAAMAADAPAATTATTTAATTATGGAVNTAATAEGLRATGEAPAAAATAETAAGGPTTTTMITPCTAAEERVDEAVEPYSIPPSIHHCVWQDNLRFQQESRLLDQTYFRFLLQLARVNLDVFQMCHDRGKMAALSDARAGGVKASPQRSEALRVERAAEETAEALLSLLLPFLFRVYLRAHASLRTEDPLWTDVLSRMLDANSTACRLFNARMAGNRRWLLHFLLKCPINAISVAVADLLVTSCHSATCFVNARPLAAGSTVPTATPAAAAAAAGGAPEGSAGDAGAAGAAGGAGAGAAGEDALNVDALIDSLVSLLRDASGPSCHVDNVTLQHLRGPFTFLLVLDSALSSHSPPPGHSLQLCSILVEYARIGPTQRLSLIRRQLPATCVRAVRCSSLCLGWCFETSQFLSTESCPPHLYLESELALSAGSAVGACWRAMLSHRVVVVPFLLTQLISFPSPRPLPAPPCSWAIWTEWESQQQPSSISRPSTPSSPSSSVPATPSCPQSLDSPPHFSLPIPFPSPPFQLDYLDRITSNLDNHDTISLLLYISFGNESESITVLREAMSSLQRAAVTSSRRILSLLLHLLKLPDSLQEQVSPLKRYALLKFLLATAAFSTMSRRHIAVRRADLSAVLQWLQEETANAPGHDLSNEELPSGTLRRTATVDSTIATGLSLISLPHEPNA
ncbi:unnamed protein product [Closterium sp. Naga37s-1]|nr:unnamed protein product [Closterium sp. Naga37s-1]